MQKGCLINCGIENIQYRNSCVIVRERVKKFNFVYILRQRK